MPGKRVPMALREHLGQNASLDLVDLLDAERTDWSDKVLNTAADRFERRLSEGLSTLRVEIIKLSFLSWVGQLAAMAGLLAYMFRVTGR